MSPVIIVALLLLLATLGVLFFPWSARHVTARSALNRRFYQSRLQELAREGHGPDDPLVVELQRTLLNDIPETDDAGQPAGGRFRRRSLIPGALVLVLVSTGVYLKTSSPGELLAWQQARQQFPQLLRQAGDPAADPLSDGQLAELALGLRSQLQDEPGNTAYWQMLGRIGMVLNDNPMARGAFGRAWRLAPRDPLVVLDYASALVRAGEQGSIRQGEMLLRDTLARNGPDARVLDLLAFSEYQQQRYAQAAAHWQQALALTPGDDPQHVVISGNLRQARQRSQP